MSTTELRVVRATGLAGIVAGLILAGVLFGVWGLVVTLLATGGALTWAVADVALGTPRRTP